MAVNSCCSACQVPQVPQKSQLASASKSNQSSTAKAPVQIPTTRPTADAIRGEIQSRPVVNDIKTSFNESVISSSGSNGTLNKTVVQNQTISNLNGFKQTDANSQSQTLNKADQTNNQLTTQSSFAEPQVASNQDSVQQTMQQPADFGHVTQSGLSEGSGNVANSANFSSNTALSQNQDVGAGKAHSQSVQNSSNSINAGSKNNTSNTQNNAANSSSSVSNTQPNASSSSSSIAMPQSVVAPQPNVSMAATTALAAAAAANLVNSAAVPNNNFSALVNTAISGSKGANQVASTMNDSLSSQVAALQASAAKGNVDAQALLNEVGALMKQAFGDDDDNLLNKKLKKQAQDRLADMLGGEVSEAHRIWFRKMEMQKNQDLIKKQNAVQKRIRDWLQDHQSDDHHESGQLTKQPVASAI